MNAIIQLEKLGYIFTWDGDRLRYTHQGDSPDPAIVGPLLTELKQDKDRAVQFLTERAMAKEERLKIRLGELLAAFANNAPERPVVQDESVSVTHTTLPVKMTSANGGYWLRFPDDADFVHDLKLLPSHAFKWEPEQQAWWLSELYINCVVDFILAHYGVDLTPERNYPLEPAIKLVGDNWIRQPESGIFGFVPIIKIGKATVRLVASGCWIRTPFSQEFMAQFKKQIPGDCRKWYPNSKQWWIYRAYTSEVLVILALHFAPGLLEKG